MPDTRVASEANEVARIVSTLRQAIAEARDLSREHGFDDVEFRRLVNDADEMLEALAIAIRGPTLH